MSQSQSQNNIGNMFIMTLRNWVLKQVSILVAKTIERIRTPWSGIVGRGGVVRINWWRGCDSRGRVPSNHFQSQEYYLFFARGPQDLPFVLKTQVVWFFKEIAYKKSIVATIKRYDKTVGCVLAYHSKIVSSNCRLSGRITFGEKTQHV